jgi:hypothetical protein
MKKNNISHVAKKPAAATSAVISSIEGHLGSMQDAIWHLEDAIGKPGCVSRGPTEPRRSTPDEKIPLDAEGNPDLGKLNPLMVKAAQPFVRQLKENPGSLSNDVWICREGHYAKIEGFLVSRPGDPADIIAYVENDAEEVKSSHRGAENPHTGSLHENFCAAVMIAALGDNAGYAAWAHVGGIVGQPENIFGDVDSPSPTPGRLFGVYISRPFPKNPDGLGEDILFPLCRFRFAKMLQRYVDRKMNIHCGAKTREARRYVVGYIDELTGKTRLAILTTGTGLDLSVGEIDGWR